MNELDLLRTIPSVSVKKNEKENDSDLRAAVQNSIMEVDTDAEEESDDAKEEESDDASRDIKGRIGNRIKEKIEDCDSEDEGIDNRSESSGERTPTSNHFLPEASQDDLDANFVPEQIMASSDDDGDNDDENKANRIEVFKASKASSRKRKA